MEINLIQRRLEITDYTDLRNAMILSYPDLGSQIWKESTINRLIDLFPEGQLCIELNGKLVGVGLSIIVDYDQYADNHTYDEITANCSFTTHTIKGDYLYCIEIFVHPEQRGMRLGRRIYEARKELCENMNLKGMVAGGRLPNYADYADTLKPKNYIEKVKNREIYDPVLSFQLANGFHVLKIIKGYLPGDSSSLEYASLIEWKNVYYEKPTKGRKAKTEVRIGLVQWQMRQLNDLDHLYEYMEFFIDSLSGYKSDFILFPELFNAPLMASCNHLEEIQAIRELAKMTQQIFEKCCEYAVAYNINIITGSMPFQEGDKLLNVGFLCRRDGTWERYEKIHITPSEISCWNITGGDRVRVFDTDAGKIGVLICYDSEFPELSRILADQGMQILFVPFLTDTQNGFSRVMRCTQARAIENECYVATAGCIGNLPKVRNMDIQYAQSAVYTPCDFPFPFDGIKAQTTPNTEMTLVVDVDLNLLKELHHKGSVRILKDRRKDLYEINYKGG